MSREIRRVPLDFNAPLGVVWPGYLMPDDMRLPQCPDCGGNGYSPQAQHLHDLWYGNAPFRPQDNGSTPHTPDTPAVRAFAERNVERSPDYYGTGEHAIRREARRLAALWNKAWSHHLNAADVAALIAADRLRDFTHTWTKDQGWQPRDPMPTPTPEQVNEWSIRTMGHDSCNAWSAIRGRAERDGVPLNCPTCDGEGNVATAEQRSAYEAWERTEPPTGEGWQLWSTTSEGEPSSPVFASGDELAVWMSQHRCGFARTTPSLDAAMKMVHGSGWAPSMIYSPEHGLQDGITALASQT